MMDKDKNAQLSFDEFQEGSKADPTIISALTLVRGVEYILRVCVF